MADDQTTPGLGAQSVGSGIAAAGGLAIGGPVGALVASMSAPYLMDVAMKSWGEILEVRRQNVGSFVGQASAQSGIEAEDLLDAAFSSSEGTALFADGMRAAAETLDQRKVAGLARAVANGLINDQAEVDENLMIVRALADIEEPHVRLLGRLSASKRGSSLTPGDAALVAVLERNGLAQDDAHSRAVAATDEQGKAIDKVLGELGKALAGKKARVPSKLARPSGTSMARTRPRYRRTSFGTLCLEHLFAAAIDVDLDPMDQIPTEDEDASDENFADET